MVISHSLCKLLLQVDQVGTQRVVKADLCRLHAYVIIIYPGPKEASDKDTLFTF